MVCVHNTTGRAPDPGLPRLPRAAALRDAATPRSGSADDGTLRCRRCGTERPAGVPGVRRVGVRQPAPGVTRLREELEAAAGRPVVAVTGPRRRRRRPTPRSTSAPRRCCTACRAPTWWRSSTSTPSCWPRATGPPSRRWRCSCAPPGCSGRRERGGRLLVQTFLPDHEVIQAACSPTRPGCSSRSGQRRQLLGLPPCVGARRGQRRRAATRSPIALRAVAGVDVGGAPGRHLVRAADWDELGAAPHRHPPPEGLPRPHRRRPPASDAVRIPRVAS